MATTEGTGRREDGFTLIELLVVVIIMGALAVIAVPSFMRQRQKAWQVAAQAEVRQGALQAELYYAEYDTYEGLDTVELRTSNDMELTVTDPSVSGYCLEGDHRKLDPAPDYHFDLELGAPVQGGCVDPLG